MTFNFEKIAPEYVDGFLEMVKKNQWSQVVRYVDENALCTEKIGCCGNVDPLKRAIFEHFPETKDHGKKYRKSLRQWLLLSVDIHVQIHGPGARSIFIAQDVYNYLRQNQALTFEKGKAYIKGNGRVIEVQTSSSIDFMITVI